MRSDTVAVVLSAYAVLYIACAGSKSQPSQPASAPASKCAHVADHLLSLLTPTARDAPAEEVDRVRAMFHARCRDDGWSLAAQECFLALRAKEDVDKCAAQLTDAQRAALEQPTPAAPEPPPSPSPSPSAQ